MGGMVHYSEYSGHKKRKYKVKKRVYDETVYTFDIEASSVVLHNHLIYSQTYYDELTNEEKRLCEVYGFMYIWMFSIEDVVYYGRTWDEFKEFFSKVFPDDSCESIVYVHNLSYEAQFLRGVIPIDDVFAREKYKPMYLKSGSVTFKCSYVLTQSKLEKLPEYYGLEVEKLVGSLDYEKIRHQDTPLTEEELAYCKNDCLVLYEFVKKMAELYKHLHKIPLTKTGVLRRRCKSTMNKSINFRCRMREMVNLDPRLHTLLSRCFAGGYTHANYFYSDVVLENVTSYDICSSYPYIMCCERCFPTEAFHKCEHITLKNMRSNAVYIIHLKIKNLKSIKENSILSFSKCFHISENHVVDNGRLLNCESLETILTNYDYEILKEFYSFDEELVEIWGAPAGYLPKDFIEFVLEVYEKKTKLKDVEGREEEYQREKSDFNSLYGMSVTNTIRDDISYSDGEWHVHELTPFDILDKLKDEAKKPFLHFSYGVFITSKARYNLLKAVSELDEWNAYSDTDSLKLVEGFDKMAIYRYNERVAKTVKEAEKRLGLTGFVQKDIHGVSHCLGLLEKEGVYKKFKTLGAKKYCYEDQKGKIHITVSGVPKKGATLLKSVEDFKESLVFPASVTGKLMAIYSEEKDVCLTVTDYLGNTSDICFSYGVGFVPCSYTLSQSSLFIERDVTTMRRLI